MTDEEADRLHAKYRDALNQSFAAAEAWVKQEFAEWLKQRNGVAPSVTEIEAFWYYAFCKLTTPKPFNFYGKKPSGMPDASAYIKV